MKNFKKTVTVMLAIVLIISFAPLQTQAASKNYMGKLNVSWDLKKTMVLPVS